MSPLSSKNFLDLSRQADLNLVKGWRVIATLIESSESASLKLLMLTRLFLNFLNFLWFQKLMIFRSFSESFETITSKDLSNLYIFYHLYRQVFRVHSSI